MTDGQRYAVPRPRRARRRALAVTAAVALVVGCLGWASASSVPAGSRVAAEGTSTPTMYAGLVAPLRASDHADVPVTALAPGGPGAAVAGPAAVVGGSVPRSAPEADPLVERLVADMRAALEHADAGDPLPAQVTPDASVVQFDSDPLPAACTAEPGESRHQVCVVGDEDGDRSAALIGSSHIMMWIPGLRAEAERAGVRLSVFVKYGCAPYTFAMRRGQVPWTECMEWRDWAISELNDMSPELVIAGSHAWVDIAAPNGSGLDGEAFDDAWYGGVHGLVSSLAPVVEAGGRVTLLGDTTRRSRIPGRCAERRGATYAMCEQRITLDTVRLNSLSRLAAESAGGTYYDPDELVCLDARCPAVSDGRFVFRDGLGHVTATYARHVAPALAARVGLTR